MKANVNTRLQTRTGINRDWGVVEESILYNREVFEQDMRFWGEMILPDELAGTFRGFVEEADAEDVVRLGTGRTRGLGRVNIEISEAETKDTTDFENRLTNFDATVKMQAQKAEVRNLAPFYIAITLYSASILCDPFMRYHKTIEADILNEQLDHSTITLERIYQSAGIRRISGWNELWGTPRMHDYAMEMGSTFLFTCSEKPDDVLVQALYKLEEEGIGCRRSEGFGRVCISDPFHLEGEQS